MRNRCCKNLQVFIVFLDIFVESLLGYVTNSENVTELILKIYLMALDANDLADFTLILNRMAVKEYFKDPYAVAQS